METSLSVSGTSSSYTPNDFLSMEDSWRQSVPYPSRTRSLILRGVPAFALLFATTLATPSYFQPVETQAASEIWRLETAKTIKTVISQSALEDDMELDSPNWMPYQLTQLAARGFKRINDPRRVRVE